MEKTNGYTDVTCDSCGRLIVTSKENDNRVFEGIDRARAEDPSKPIALYFGGVSVRATGSRVEVDFFTTGFSEPKLGDGFKHYCMGKCADGAIAEWMAARQFDCGLAFGVASGTEAE